METHLSHHPDETSQMAREFVSSLQGGEVVCLYGELGAGKTFFVQEVLKALGYTKEVTSPTFTLVHEYKTPRFVVYHLDLYRIDEPQDIKDLGILDVLGNKETVFFIEWPEKMGAFLPKTRIDIYLADVGPQTRKVVFDFSHQDKV